MKCEKCGYLSELLDKYKFYYGNFIGSHLVDRRHSLSRYKIAGSIEVTLCQSCVGQFIDRIRLSVSAGLVLLGLVGSLVSILIKQSVQNSGSEIFAGVFIIVLAIIFYFATYKEWRKGKNRSGFGDQLAIRLKKKELKNAGYLKFFTRSNYDALI